MVTTFSSVTLSVCYFPSSPSRGLNADCDVTVLYHQPDKMAKAKDDLEVRKEQLERIKQQNGID